MEIKKPKQLRELVSERHDARKPVIDGILRPKETLNIIAPHGTGKSRLAIALACAVATGRTWLGQQCARGKVLYVSSDLPSRAIAERLEQHLVGIRPHDRDAALVNIDVLDASGLEGLPDALDRCLDTADGGDYILVIVDSLDGVVPRNAESERRGKVVAMHETIDVHAIRRKCAVVLIQHMAADRTDAIIDDLAASWTSLAADSNIAMLPASRASDCRMCVTTRSFDDKPLSSFRSAVSWLLRH